jgi:hypothetical protein
MRRVTTITVLALAATVLTSPAAAASAGPNTVEGTCELSGKLTFDDPLGNAPRETGFTDRAAGTCTGKLNGVPQQDAPVLIRGRGSGTMSCLAGHTTSSARLTFTRGTRRASDDAVVHFFTDTSGALLQFVSRFSGAHSGDGIAHVSFLAYADEASFAACQAGALESARYDLLTRTITPIVG